MSTESPTRRENPASARDRILDVAGPLFWREGYRAIGVDRVIAEADVAKATFYKHFPSKDDLIVAWIERAEAMTKDAAPPVDGPCALTDFALAMIAIAGGPQCMGCTFQGSAAEFAEPGHPAHAAAIGVKRRTLSDMEARARAEGLPDPAGAARRVFLLLEGVWASVRMFGSDAPLEAAREALPRLLR
jgi:AcrR family transcriptional regulator